MRAAEIRTGDAMAVLLDFEAATFDAIVTDPPYGLRFMGKDWDHGVPGAGFWGLARMVAKPGAHLLAFGGTRTYHRLTCAIEDAGWEIRDCLSWLYGSGFPKSHNGAWGGTALKPAWEPIILARKPLAGTVAANAQQHGTGALNIDACRLAFASQEDQAAAAAAEQRLSHDQNAGRTAYGRFENGPASLGPYLAKMDRGRWPANVVLDEDAAAMLDEQSGELAAGNHPARRRGIGYTETSGGANSGTNFDRRSTEVGGASRFFYTAKASRSERERMEGGGSARVVGVWGGDEDDLSDGKKSTLPRRNHHPTVKPLDLMRWLVRLVTPPNGLILDPFCGSGTTGCAALAEGFRFVGIEREPEYVAIAEARLNATQPALPLQDGAA